MNELSQRRESLRRNLFEKLLTLYVVILSGNPNLLPLLPKISLKLTIPTALISSLMFKDLPDDSKTWLLYCHETPQTPSIIKKARSSTKSRNLKLVRLDRSFGTRLQEHQKEVGNLELTIPYAILTKFLSYKATQTSNHRSHSN